MTAMRRLSKEADAQSKETTFSGLPKTCKLVNSVDQTGLAATAWTALRFDTVAFNYGGYTFYLAAGIKSGITVPEPGVYDIEVQASPGGTAAAYLAIWLNNSIAVMPDGTQATTGSTTAATNQVLQTRSVMELRAGDIVTPYLFPQVAVTALATQQWLTVTKLGGMY